MNRVCHITSVHPRYDGRIFQRECVSLKNAGYEVTLLCIDGKGDEVKDGVQIVSVKHIFKNRIERIRNSAKILYKKAIEIDAEIYHLHDPELIKLGLKLLKKGKKVVFDAHEDYSAAIQEKTWIPRPLRRLVQYFYQISEKKLKKFTGIISVTPHICKKHKKNNPNVVMITNYPILEDLKMQARSIGNYICFSGGVSEQWMHETIIEAVAKFDGKIRYKLAGNPDPKYLERLKMLDGWKYVDYLGFQNKGEIFKLHRGALAGMALNNYNANVNFKEGSLGNTKIFEYMAAGLPVICTDFVLWKDLIEKYKAGICICPSSVEQTVRSIELLQQNDLAAELGDNGRRAAEEKYNWHTQELILIDFYSKIFLTEET